MYHFHTSDQRCGLGYICNVAWLVTCPGYNWPDYINVKTQLLWGVINTHMSSTHNLKFGHENHQDRKCFVILTIL